IPTFAIGNGTVNSLFTMTGGPSDGSSAQVRAWLGDTQASTTATSSDYYSQVSAGTLPTVASVSTAFLTVETWNCQAETSNPFYHGRYDQRCRTGNSSGPNRQVRHQIR